MLGWLIDDAARAFGGLDIAIANVSALATAPGEQSWQQAFNIDILGTIRLVEAAIPHLEQSDSGAIVNIASVSGLRPSPGTAAYGAAKAGLINLTRSLAIEWADRGVRVNGVAPGYVATDLTHGMRDNSGIADRLLGEIPLGRFAEPSEMAGMIAYLCSDASSYVTGQVFAVDGGFSAGHAARKSAT